jgi:hypothetical protein
MSTCSCDYFKCPASIMLPFLNILIVSSMLRNSPVIISCALKIRIIKYIPREALVPHTEHTKNHNFPFILTVQDSSALPHTLNQNFSKRNFFFLETSSPWQTEHWKEPKGSFYGLVPEVLPALCWPAFQDMLKEFPDLEHQSLWLVPYFIGRQQLLPVW